jgi:hypothetical protein
MHLSTDDGDLAIHEEDLSSLTKRELKKLRITPEELRRCWADAMELMRGEDWARGRPCCDETLDGKWIVIGPVG